MSICHLHTVRSSHTNKTGGKAASLGELLHAGHPVPPGFVITTDETLLSPTLSEDILKAYDLLGTHRVAVRSSGVGEDGQEQSWAGQFATILHVERNGLLDAVRACWDSASAERVTAYADGTQLKLAVLVQHMVHSAVAGVAFSVNPITGDTNEVIVESVYGLGELLVQGTVTPDSFLANKETGEIIDQDITQKESMLAYQNGGLAEMPVTPELQIMPSLTPSQVHAVTSLARNIETYYGYPIDIEWAFEDGRLYLLQARPITTL